MFIQDIEILRAVGRNRSVTNCYAPFFVDLPQSSNALAAAVNLKGCSTEVAGEAPGWRAVALALPHGDPGFSRGAERSAPPRIYFF